MNNLFQLRLFGMLGIAGFAFFGIFSLLHPLTFNPWDAEGALEKISRHHFWTLDHIFIFFSLTLWLLAMIAGKQLLPRNGMFKETGSSLFVLALAVWVVILTFEIGVIPFLVEALEHHHAPSLMLVWFVVYCFGLLAGYFAFLFIWIGIFFYSLAMTDKSFPHWFRAWGVFGGLTGAIGIIAGLINIEFVAVIVGVTSSPPFLWVLLFFWFMIRPPKPNANVLSAKSS